MNEFIIGDVLAAMQRKELKVYYQPKVDATTSCLKSAQALVRWVRDDGSVVLPKQFLPWNKQAPLPYSTGMWWSRYVRF